MIEQDKYLYRAMLDYPEGATLPTEEEADDENLTEAEINAALCGARRFLPVGMIDDQEQAGEDVAIERAGSLSARQSRVAAMLAGGMSVKEAAIVTGLHRGTIFRWRQNSAAFRKEQCRIAAEASAELSIMSRRLLVKATGYIDRLMEDAAGRDEWAKLILRNRRLWQMAVEAKGEASA